MPCTPAAGGPPAYAPRSQAPAYVPPKLKPVRTDAKPLVRAQNEDDGPSPIRIPTPEELGLGGEKAAEETVDWDTIERMLDAAGATGFQVERTSSGYRFTCRVPAGPVTGRGATKPEAVRNALAQLGR